MPGLTYEDRTFSAIADIDRDRPGAEIHHNTIQAQVKQTARKNKTPVGSKCTAWVHRTVRTTIKRGILARVRKSGSPGFLVLTPHGKRCLAAGRRMMPSNPTPHQQHRIWDSVFDRKNRRAQLNSRPTPSNTRRRVTQPRNSRVDVGVNTELTNTETEQVSQLRRERDEESLRPLKRPRPSKDVCDISPTTGRSQTLPPSFDFHFSPRPSVSLRLEPRHSDLNDSGCSDIDATTRQDRMEEDVNMFHEPDFTGLPTPDTTPTRGPNQVAQYQATFPFQRDATTRSGSFARFPSKPSPLDRLQSRIAELLKEVVVLKATDIEKEREIYTRGAQIQSLEVAIDEKNTAHINLEKSLAVGRDSWGLEKSRFERQLKDFETRYGALLADKRKLIGKLGQAQNELKAQEEKFKQLLDAKDRRIEGLDSKLNQALKEVVQMQQNLAAAVDMQVEVQKHTEEREKQLQEELGVKDGRIQQIGIQLGQAQHVNRTRGEKIMQLEGRITHFEVVVQNKQGELDHFQQMIDQLTAELIEAQNFRDDVAARLEEAEKRLKDRDDKISDLQSSLHSTTEELSTLRDGFRDLRNAFSSSLRAGISIIRSAFGSEQDYPMSGSDDELDVLKATHARLIPEFVGHAAGLLDQKYLLQRSLTAAQGEVERLEKELMDANESILEDDRVVKEFESAKKRDEETIERLKSSWETLKRPFTDHIESVEAAEASPLPKRRRFV